MVNHPSTNTVIKMLNAPTNNSITCCEADVNSVLYSFTSLLMCMHTYKQPNRQNWFSGAKHSSIILKSKFNLLNIKAQGYDALFTSNKRHKS